MTGDDLYALLTTQDEPTAQQRAAAMSDALRRKSEVAAAHRGMGLVTSMGQNSLLGGLNRASMGAAEQLGQEASQGQQMLAHAGQMRAGQALQRALQAQQQAFAASQGEAAREATASESKLGRDATARQAGLNRAAEMERLKLELGMRERLAAEKAKTDKADASSKAGGDLRKEFQGLPEVKTFKEIDTAFKKVSGAAKSGTPAGDMSLIYAYMKLLDPGSSVKEGEYHQAGQTTGVPGQVINLYNRAKDGQLLNPQQRAEFAAESSKLYAVHRNQFGSTVGRYRGLAEKAGVTPDDVALEMQPESPQASIGGSDAEAVAWARANPGNPDAQAVLKAAGVPK